MGESTQADQGDDALPAGFTVVVSSDGEDPEGTEHVQASQPPSENKAIFIKER